MLLEVNEHSDLQLHPIDIQNWVHTTKRITIGINLSTLNTKYSNITNQLGIVNIHVNFEAFSKTS